MNYALSLWSIITSAVAAGLAYAWYKATRTNRLLIVSHDAALEDNLDLRAKNADLRDALTDCQAKCHVLEMQTVELPEAKPIPKRPIRGSNGRFTKKEIEK